MTLLTTCAACGKSFQAKAKQCGRCKSPYCNATCQTDHWRRGHKQMCKKIARAGGAEQHHAEKKYKEAVADAVEACAEDTKGQTCFICTEAVHRRTKEGLVRGCACGDRAGVASGTAGIAHVSCLAEQAKILVAEAMENNLGAKVQNARWRRWHTCGLCEQKYHGPVKCALGWACWKTYLGRPETDPPRIMAESVLGNGLRDHGDRFQDALDVFQITLAKEIKTGGRGTGDVLCTMSSMAICYNMLGRADEALELERQLYRTHLKHDPRLSSPDTILAGNNLAGSLVRGKLYAEARGLLKTIIPTARRSLGDDQPITLNLRGSWAQAIYMDERAASDEKNLVDAVATCEDCVRISRRVMGPTHPKHLNFQDDLRRARAVLALARGEIDADACMEAFTRKNVGRISTSC